MCVLASSELTRVEGLFIQAAEVVDKKHTAVVSEHTRGLSILGRPAGTSKLGLSEGSVAGNSVRCCQPSDLELHKDGARHPIFAVAKIGTPSRDERA